MRGAHAAELLLHEQLGIIPAYAGSTGLAKEARSCTRDHPRVCGEHLNLRTSVPNP